MNDEQVETRIREIVVSYGTTYAGEPEFGVRTEVSKGAVAALLSLFREAHPKERQAPVQGERVSDGVRERLPAGSIPWHIYELAMVEYNRRHSQTPEVLASRGGLSWTEVVALFRGEYSDEGVGRVSKELEALG